MPAILAPFLSNRLVTDGSFTQNLLSSANSFLHRAGHQIPFLGGDSQQVLGGKPVNPHADIPTAMSSNDTIRPAANGKVNFAYFAQWGIYGRNYQAYDTPINDLTHVLYAFANIRDDGSVFSADTYADEQKHYTDASVENPDSWNEPAGTTNLYGSMKRFGLLKKKNRNLKILMSIGGWTYSARFWPSMSTDAGRKTFASTAVQMLEDYGLDGLDIDWEYPTNQEQAQAFTALLAECRSQLNAAAARRSGNKPYFWLTAAVSAGASKISVYDIKGMNKYLDLWNVMAYDYAGSWSKTAGHQANLFKDGQSTSSEAEGDTAIKQFMDAGVPANKLVFGLPLYGRSFDQTDGIGKPFQGVGSGSWENGVWDLKALPQAGASIVEASGAGASYSYDSSKRFLVSYDTPKVFAQKTQYIKDKQLAGAMFWELSGDYPRGGQIQPMVNKVAQSLGSFDTTQNCIDYPFSRFDNTRKFYA